MKCSLGSFVLAFLVGGCLLPSCVSRKKYDALGADLQKCREEAAGFRRDAEARLEDAQNEINRLRAEVSRLKADTSRTGQTLRRSQSENRLLREEKNDLERRLDDLISRGRGETAQILAQLKDREERLKLAEDELREKQKLLEKQQAELAEKQKRVEELERILAEQKEALNSLLSRIQNALKGYSGQGLRVYEKDGKVYVSLDEQLLFESGRTEVKPEGQRALRDLAAVLEKEKDISLLIEGHTDNVPLRPGSLMKDNWDLSVLRATSVARIILQNPAIAPQRITAAGRGEYLPVASNATPEGRAQNRRTDIIITPRLQDILEVLKKN
jgi:chemotaxis protein MotB